MKSNRRATMARKAFTVLMVLAMATSAIFASPLNTTGTVGDTKTYDSNYKAASPADIAEGWVIRTSNDEFCVANEDISLEFGANSLAKIESLDAALEVYLLDGSVMATSDKREFTIKTPATVYKAQPGTILFVVSDSASESGYVEMGSAQANNSITKAVTDIMPGTYIDNSQSNFVPAQTNVQEFKAAVEAVATTEPAEKPAEIAVEAKPVETAEAAAEPATEPASEPEDLAMVKTFSIGGIEFTVKAYIGKAYIYYPTYVTDQEVINAAYAASEAYGNLLNGVYFTIVEPGMTEVTYPQTYGPEEFFYAMGILETDLPYYLIQMYGIDETSEVVVEETAVEEEPVAEPAEEPAVEEPVEAIEPADQALTASFSYYGINAEIKAYIGEAYITYPSFVTDKEIADAAAAAYAAYSNLLDGIYFTIVEPGLVKVTYPETYGPAEFDYAVELIDKELPLYLAYILNIQEPAAEPVVETVVAEEPEAQPVAEQPAEAPAEPVSEPAAEPTQEPLKTALETVSKEEAAAQVKKDNAFRFGATIAAAYGVDNGTPYSSISALREKVGTYKKGLLVSIDPYITSKTLTFGLHLAVNPFDLAGSFTANTSGITGWTNTVMSYISVFRFQKEALTIAADRTSELEFTSPIATALRREFNSSDELLGTLSLKGKYLSLYAFVDDLQFTDKLNGKDQFMGARAAFSFKSFEIGASAVANVAKGLRETVIYPAVDATLPIKLGNTTITLSGGAAAQIGVFSENKVEGYMAEAKATLSSGAISMGVGAAYNTGKYFNNIMNNGPCTVISQFTGKAIDVILSAGINTKHFAVNAEITAPFAIEGGSRLVYNTVKTANGSTATISADTFTVQADLMLGHFTFSAGAAYDGLCGRLADTAKAFIQRSNRRAAVVGLVDPQISTYYAVADLSVGMFDIWARADYARINGSLTLPVSVGLSIKF